MEKRQVLGGYTLLAGDGVYDPNPYCPQRSARPAAVGKEAECAPLRSNFREAVVRCAML